ncbi:mitochondrial lysine-tRNA synthetase [Candidozyma auris]|uniref:Lysyl-tRNA synthetase n=2 Tax=Candidozyma auris TaxID=498019 RepID=A0A2H0ZHI6_CANAR|nr:hypothetical protein QG37_06916 [[Candida] auris]PIS49703.1 lysine-tRNA ligase [[Candida] auris]QWW25170.1 hypothetical protein CA7LBN_004052 [[Candida] auris]
MFRAPQIRLRRHSLKDLYFRIPSCRYSSDEAAKYAHRKTIVAQNPAQYYPPIGITRTCTPVLRVRDFVSRFGKMDFTKYASKRHPDLVQLEGRVKSVRKAGKAMYFLDIVQDDAVVQICASNKLLGNMDKEMFARLHSFIRKGDYITCVGQASVTNVGELTLKVNQPIMVSCPSLNLATLPDKVSDRSLINSDRVMNYLVNSESKERILIKAAVTRAIRNFLLEDNFTEVNTPLIAGAGTGANAEPFYTTSKALQDARLQLRVAPELWLKKLVIGGFDKVFEIGPNFRNEGIDSTHNPEFLTCEFYRSFTSLPELMKLTEDMLKSIYDELAAKQDDIKLLQHTLTDLSPLKKQEYPKFEFVPTLEEKTGVKLPEELTTEALLKYHDRIGVSPPKTKSPAGLLDNLSSKLLETISLEQRNTPTFIYNQPAIMSPLAKSATVHYDERAFEVSLRFELFINGKEYVNSYEEENSPFAQADKFRLQQRAKADYQDNDMLIPDWNYVKSMEYGLPPTGGWGCGIDRLSMLFSGTSRIEDVLTFGVLKDVVKQ